MIISIVSHRGGGTENSVKEWRMRTHLGEIIDHDVPVSLIYQGKHLPACRFVRVAGEERNLSLLVRRRCGPFAPGDPLSASYNFGPYIYTFETEIVGAHPMDGDSTALILRSPKQIARLERRKSYRVAPSPLKPVTVHIHSAGTEVTTEAKDIGRHGVAFLLPTGAPSFGPGANLHLEIHLPSLGTVTLQGVTRTRRDPDASGAMHYGVEFTPAVEFDSPLAQYVHWRKLEAHQGRKGDSRTKTVLVAIKECQEGTFAFACSSSGVSEITDFSAFSEIVSADVIDFLEDETVG